MIALNSDTPSHIHLLSRLLFPKHGRLRIEKHEARVLGSLLPQTNMMLALIRLHHLCLSMCYSCQTFCLSKERHIDGQLNLFHRKPKRGTCQSSTGRIHMCRCPSIAMDTPCGIHTASFIWTICPEPKMS